MARDTLLAACTGSPSDSIDAWRTATTEQRAQLEPDQRALVVRAIRDGQAEVPAALIAPAEPLDWHVALNAVGGAMRYLSAVYRTDDQEGERRAWAAIKAARRCPSAPCCLWPARRPRPGGRGCRD